MAAMPSGTNTFIPSWEASGKLVAGFSRNTADYCVNRVAQLVPTRQVQGLYQVYDSKQAHRVDLNRFIWADGASAPDGTDNLAAWTHVPFLCERFAPTFTVGELAVDQADWDLIARCGAMAANQAMTWRTLRYLQALANAPWGSHAIQVLTGGGTPGPNPSANVDWGSGNEDNPVIQRALLAGALLINRDTNATVKTKNLKLLLSPEMAVAMANTAEVHGYVARSPFALAQIKGDEPNQNFAWGLPSHLYGFELQIEESLVDTSVVKSQNPFTDAMSRCFPTNGCYLISRVGGLEGTVPDAPNFSTVVGFVQEDMTTETKYDTDHRRTWGRVVQNLTFVVPAVASGVQFTNCFATTPQ